jgi:hypothetical protein
MGLVIFRRLAQRMGGTVEVESEPGVGTCMTLQLPFEICRATGPVRSESADHEALKALVAGRRTPDGTVGAAGASGQAWVPGHVPDREEASEQDMITTLRWKRAIGMPIVGREPSQHRRIK